MLERKESSSRETAVCTESKLFENNDLDHDHLMGGYWLGKNKGIGLSTTLNAKKAKGSL